MKYKTLFFLLLISKVCFPQKSNFHFCNQKEIHEEKKSNDSLYKKRNNSNEKVASSFFKENFQLKTTTPKTLPVVVHVIHDDGAENLSSDIIENAIELLNDAFANQGYYDQGSGVNTEIQFCLAQRTPDNQPSTGINRIQSNLTEFNYFSDDQNLKDLSRWNPREYINIWVVRDICNSNGCSVAGYAYLPSAHGEPFDGIVVEANYMGLTEPNTSVLVHEMGHYLGLYHTFEEGCRNNDCLNQGDRVCDTPPDNSTAWVPCDHPANSCNTDSNSGFTSDQLDMLNNYMDYSRFGCYNAFTQGQSDRMHFFIENIRHSLLDSKACESPCPMPVTANFTASDLTIEVGNSLFFENTSVNGSDFTWKVNGIPVSTDEDLNFPFREIGNQTITLIAENNLPDCITDSLSISITVICDVKADFYTASNTQLVNQNFKFKSLSANAISRKWTINGLTESTAEEFEFTRTAPGLILICFEVESAFCADQKCVTVEFKEEEDDCTPIGIYTLKNDNSDENPMAISIAPDGNLFIGGRLDDASFISKVTINGDVLWVKKYDFSSLADERIVKLFLDSEGYLVGCGTGRTSSIDVAEGFAFKFDTNTENLVWANNSQGSAPSIFYYEMREIPSTGNYLISGQSYNNNCNANLVELNKTTGQKENTFLKNFDVGSCETFNKFDFVNGGIFALGRFNYAGGGTDKMRGVHSFLDMDGNELWHKNYLVGLNQTARMYGLDFLQKDGRIYSVMNGSFNSTSLADADLALLNCAPNGDLDWAIRYDLPGVMLLANNIFATDTHFFIDMIDNTNKRLIVLKLDLQGNIVWALRFNEWEAKMQRGLHAMLAGDQLFISIGVQDQTEDGLFLKIPTDERPEFDDCIDVEFVNFNVTPLSNPHVANGTSIAQNYNFSISNKSTGSATWNFTKEPVCELPCPEDCTNGTDDDGDGLVDCDDPDCPCDEDCDNQPDAIVEFGSTYCEDGNIYLSVNVCNLGEIPIPADMPVTFFFQDPLTIRQFVRTQFRTNKVIQPGDCEAFPRPWDHQITKVYGVANYGLSGTPPINLPDDFPLTNITECNYLNNLDSINLTFQNDLQIDIGDDVSICPNQSFSVVATSNSGNYRWHDGSRDSSITVFEEGLVWCCVVDECGFSACDTIEVSFDDSYNLPIPSRQLICEGDSTKVELNTSNLKYFWYPKGAVSCDTCSTVTIFGNENKTITLVGESDDGCIVVDSFEVEILPLTASYDTLEICKGSFIEYQGNQLDSAGDYEYLFASNIGCDSILYLHLEETPEEFRVSLPSSTSIKLGESVTLSPQTNQSAVAYSWSPPDYLDCVDCFEVIATPFATTNYTFTAENEAGCLTIATALIEVDDNKPFYIPSAFSPNSDGINDFFTIYGGIAMTSIIELNVFNRWGEQIWKGQDLTPNDETQGWDGTFRNKPLNSAVFAYYGIIEFVDGSREIVEGDITLLK